MCKSPDSIPTNIRPPFYQDLHTRITNARPRRIGDVSITSRGSGHSGYITSTMLIVSVQGTPTRFLGALCLSSQQQMGTWRIARVNWGEKKNLPL